MRLLLDTHVVLWWLRDDPKLGPKARRMIAAGNVEILVSIATPWEVSIKHRLGKLDESGVAVMTALADAGIPTLPINALHLETLEGLPKFHNDPFDHLILAQASAEQAALMTSDRAMTSYGVPCIGVA